MSFIDSLRRASFRGFEFDLESDEKAFGRDVKKHKIINGDTVYYEDTGVKERAFTVEAAIGGTADFIAQADQFEALLAQKGEGRLVLPHTGEMSVVVTEARRRHSSREVGIVYFSITFERTEKSNQTQGTNISSATALLTASEGGITSAMTDFLKAYKDNVPDFVTDHVLERLGSFTGGLSSALSRAGIAFTAPDLKADTGLGLGSGLVDMFKGLTSRFASKLDFSVATSAPEYTQTVPALSLVKILGSVAKTTLMDETLVTPVTATQSMRVSNTQAADLMTRISAVSAAAEAASYATYESKQEALQIRSDVMGVMGDLRQEAGAQRWSNSYTALGSMMAALNRDIDEELGRLPATAIIDSVGVRSSMALAHRVFGNTPARVVDMAADIVRRNNVLHPSFIPAEHLEVLLDA